MSEINNPLAYVVGESYAELTKLPGVLTATQFYTAVLEGGLPRNSTWMLGQGMTNAEKKLMTLCKTHRSDISFYDINEKKFFHLSSVDISKRILSKLSRLVAELVHYLGFYR